jgi:DNA-binding GntR family transcriptional regulator
MTQAVAEGGSKAERAYRLIRDRIVDGTYAPGYRLVLDQVAKELAVSPLPVREAIRRLEAEGYVEFRHNVGAQVARIDSAEYGETMRALALLEGAATGLAAQHLTEQDLRRAQEVNDAIRACLATAAFDTLEFTRLNNTFHEILCAACPNPHLRGLLEREWSRLNVVRRAAFSPVPGLAERSMDDHDHLLQLILAAAPEAEIERAAREHKLGLQHAAEERRRPVPVAGASPGAGRDTA